MNVDNVVILLFFLRNPGSQKKCLDGDCMSHAAQLLLMRSHGHSECQPTCLRNVSSSVALIFLNSGSSTRRQKQIASPSSDFHIQYLFLLFYSFSLPESLEQILKFHSITNILLLSFLLYNFFCRKYFKIGTKYESQKRKNLMSL